MERFTLSRKEMADLLHSLNGQHVNTPIQILKNAWSFKNQEDIVNLLSSGVPSIFEKIIKHTKSEIGFSINEIVSLGNQIEYTHLSPSAVQNWVKRDIKELVGRPQIGKKYNVDQATMLLIVEDLKSSLDFESIRKILTLIFNNPEDRSDDIIHPIDLYSAYASVFEKLHHRPVPHVDGDGPMNEWIEQFIHAECRNILPMFKHLNEGQVISVMNVLIVSSLSAQAAYYQSAAKQYVYAALFLQE
ncbi:DUF1836 domain-containing protein [Bacillus sp. Marseille-Q1617]|uniref:DUF1836 domain-containing protein n=1 Tax=Bacillus sp. Marseille-Q1617 TaxID=2736887 RepID=UPI0020CA44FC|nr:DUF1836 domain-containing protein [Bacillus sp. Marseille-Q1617]